MTSKDTSGLALYHFVGCPYCSRVTAAMQQLGISIELRDIWENDSYRQELVKGGGKGQVPCLRIQGADGKVTWLYESLDIIKYLDMRFRS